MLGRSTAITGLFAATLMAVVMALPGQALALTSVEGAVIGDQGYYWTTPSETWIFPHRIGNVDNRVMLQLGTYPATFYNQNPIQSGNGGGVVLELLDGMNLGLWLSQYNPAHGSFVTRGVGATRFGNAVGNPGAPGTTDELGRGDVDPYVADMSATRKVDLFASYWLEDMGIEAGLHLWWGSGHNGTHPDDSTGPIDIDRDSDPATAAGDPIGVDSADDKLAIEASKYSLSDFGLGLGAGYTAMEGLRADFGFDVNMLGVNWTPNGIDNFVDAGGFGFGVNARGHYDLTDQWTVGGFARFGNQSLGFEPKGQRDGGDLIDMWNPTDPNDKGSLPDPDSGTPTGDPTSTNTEAGTGPVTNLKYEESAMNMQVAGLVRFRPNSRATLYGSFGFGWNNTTTKTSIGSDWFNKSSTRTFALPFIHLGFEGKVMSHLNMFLGATKRWQSSKTTVEAFDERIPDNDEAPGPAGTPANDPTRAGLEDNSNANRREIKRSTGSDTSTTNLMVGTRIHYGAVQLVGTLNPNVLLTGTWLLSGSAGAPWLWVSLIYDWDYDSDAESGSGTQHYSPHAAEPGVAAPAAAPAEPAPPPVEEEFES